VRVTIIYFSQTGNTRAIARCISQGFVDGGHGVRRIKLLEATADDARSGDLLGIGTACFHSKAPTPVMDFLRRLPRLDRRRAFVFATMGGEPGRVLYDMAELLRDRGAQVLGGFLCLGETRHPSTVLRGRSAGRPNARDFAAAREFGLALGRHIEDGARGPLPTSRRDVFRPTHGFYDLVALICQDPLMRLVLPAPEHVPEACTRCGWCEAECPARAITLCPDPVITGRCIRCFRCLTGCPQHAYRASWLLANLAIFSFYNSTFFRWFGDRGIDEPL